MATNKKPGRLARWAMSTKNLTGLGFAAAGPVVGVALANPLLGVALVPALYAVGALVAPGRKKPLTVSNSTDTKEAIRSLEEIQRKIRRRVPDLVARRVKYIARSITDSLRRADSLGEGSQEVYGLVKTATDYLPTALQVYLDLPRPYADRKVVSNGKTSLVILVDQLDLLIEKMDEIAEAVNRADSDKLIAHGRFLDEKFGRRGNGLDIE